MVMAKKKSVNEQYMEAFRTNSYLETVAKVQGERRNKRSRPDYDPSEFLLEPPQSIVVDIVKTVPGWTEKLVAEYFEASAEACNACDLVLRSIHEMRGNYAIQQHPFLPSLANLHERLKGLSEKLRMGRRKARGMKRLTRLCRAVAGGTLVASRSVSAAAKLVLAAHTVSSRTCKAGRGNGSGKMLSVRRGEQLGLAAMGLYVLINDLQTIGVLARAVCDDMEYSRVALDPCARSGISDVATDLSTPETPLLRHLDQLEEHVYLCIVNINKSRNRVLHEIFPPTNQSINPRD